MKAEKLFIKLCNGQLKNIKFDEFTQLIQRFGFALERVNGSHHIFTHNGGYMLNIQNVRGEAKPYQIKQFLKLVEKHQLNMI